MSFFGIGVGGDISKIDRDYDFLPITKNIKNVIDLGQFSRRGDVIKNGVISLKNIASVVLNEKMNKSPSVRFSR